MRNFLGIDYCTFGAPMVGRQHSSSSYRYSMNGQEKDDELGSGVTTAEFWEYDAKLGRRWNTDPVVKCWESPYVCFSDNPIFYTDAKGDSTSPSGKVAPAGTNEHVGADGTSLYLPTTVTPETYSTTTTTSETNHPDVSIQTTAGQVRAFVVDKTRYVASYDEKTGVFQGYKDFKTGTYYQNPDGVEPAQDDPKNYEHGMARPEYSTALGMSAYSVSFQFATGNDGQTKVVDGSFNSEITGVSLAVSWDHKSAQYSVNGSVVEFTVYGVQNYDIISGSIGTIAKQNVVIYGRYDTKTGEYVISRPQ